MVFRCLVSFHGGSVEAEREARVGVPEPIHDRTGISPARPHDQNREPAPGLRKPDQADATLIDDEERRIERQRQVMS